jgi:hypothetical protein
VIGRQVDLGQQAGQVRGDGRSEKGEQQGRDAFPGESNGREQQAQLGELPGVAAAAGERREEGRRLACFASSADLVQSPGKQWSDRKKPEVATMNRWPLRHAKIVIRSPAIANKSP